MKQSVPPTPNLQVTNFHITMQHYTSVHFLYQYQFPAFILLLQVTQELTLEAETVAFMKYLFFYYCQKLSFLIEHYIM